MVLPAVAPGQPICSGEHLQDGQSLKFWVSRGSEQFEAFLVRHQGGYYAWKNECAHIALPLDFGDNDFFTIDSRYLICKTHAAMYEPATGECVAGPCLGRPLIPVEVEVCGSDVILKA